MDYMEAVDKLLDKGGVESFLLYLIAGALLLILFANAVEAVRKLFGKKTDTASLEKHCQDSEDRFKRGEKHIAENHDHITDLKEGQRVMCVAVMVCSIMSCTTAIRMK